MMKIFFLYIALTFAIMGATSPVDITPVDTKNAGFSQVNFPSWFYYFPDAPTVLDNGDTFYTAYHNIFGTYVAYLNQVPFEVPAFNSYREVIATSSNTYLSIKEIPVPFTGYSPNQVLTFHHDGSSEEIDLSLGNKTSYHLRYLSLNSVTSESFEICFQIRYGDDTSTNYGIRRMEFSKTNGSWTWKHLRPPTLDTYVISRVQKSDRVNKIFAISGFNLVSFSADTASTIAETVLTGVKDFVLTDTLIYYITTDDKLFVCNSSDITAVGSHELAAGVQSVNFVQYTNYGSQIQSSRKTSQLLYQTNVDDKFQLNTYSPTSESPVVIYESDERIENFNLSENGQYVVFSQNLDNTNYKLYKMALDGDLTPKDKINYASTISSDDVVQNNNLSLSKDGQYGLFKVRNSVATTYDNYYLFTLAGGPFASSKVFTPNLPYSLIDNVRISSDGQKVIGSISSELKIWNTENIPLNYNEGTLVASNVTQFSADDNLENIAINENGDIKVININSNETLFLGSGKNPAISNSGTTVLFANSNNELITFELINDQWVQQTVMLLSNVSSPNISTSISGKYLNYSDGTSSYTIEPKTSTTVGTFLGKSVLNLGAGVTTTLNGDNLSQTEDNTTVAIETNSQYQGGDIAVNSSANKIALANTNGCFVLNIEQSNQAPDSNFTFVGNSTEYNPKRTNDVFELSFTDDHDLDLVPTVYQPNNGQIYQTSISTFEYVPDANFFGDEIIDITVTDSSGAIQSYQQTINVLANFDIDNAYRPGDTTYEFAIGINPENNQLEINFPNGLIDSVNFEDPTYSNLSIADGKLVVDDITELGWEDINVDWTNENGQPESIIMRLEYGREKQLSTGWNMLGVPYNLTANSTDHLISNVVSFTAWNGQYYEPFTPELSNDFNPGFALWSFCFGDSSVNLAPNVPAPAINSDRSGDASADYLEDGDFVFQFNDPTQWYMIAGVGYGDFTKRTGRANSALFTWDINTMSYISSREESTSDFLINATEGYWQYGADGFNPYESSHTIELEQ